LIGPSDLGCDLGYQNDLGADALWDVIAEAVARIAATGKAAGVFTAPGRTERMIEVGARLFGTTSDAGLLRAAMQADARSSIVIRLAHGDAVAEIDESVGNIPHWRVGGRHPLHSAPWRDEAEVQEDDSLPLVNRRLAGISSACPSAAMT
jgi:hypothetical protein